MCHNTATHQDEFKHKQNGNNHKKSGQVKIGEGLIPDAILWLAKVHHPKSKPRRRSCTRKSTKLFRRKT